MRFLAIFIFIFVLAGCATTQPDIDKATEHCANNDGVAQIQIKYNSTVRVTCNNGAKFTISYKGVK